MKENGSKISLVFDIMNVGNLLNKNWGEYYSSAYNTPIITVNSVDINKTTGVKTPSYVYGGTTHYISDYESRWHMQLGLRVTF